jgi:hypothetical protein
MLAKVRTFSVRGMGPAGAIIELSLIADTASDARKQAEDAGMRGVIVGEPQEREEGETEPPEPPAEHG